MSHLVTRSITRLSFLLVALFVLTSPAAAQDGGLRGGLTVDPISSISAVTSRRSPLVDRLYFRPNLEVGFGDDLTLIAANMEFVYKFPSRGGWRHLCRRRTRAEHLHVSTTRTTRRPMPG